MRIGCIINTLTTMDKQKTIRIGRRVMKIYKGVNYRENFIRSPSRKIVGFLFNLRLKYKNEGITILQKILKLLLKNLYGEKSCKDVTGEYKCKSKHWMSIEYDEMVLEY